MAAAAAGEGRVRPGRPVRAEPRDPLAGAGSRRDHASSRRRDRSRRGRPDRGHRRRPDRSPRSRRKPEATITNDALQLTPHESVRIRTRTADLLEVEGRWDANGSPPPKHFHPSQDERFEVLEGTLRARVDGVEREFGAGETFEVPRRAVHRIWNTGDQPARAIWRTSPAGRTAQWFEDLAALGSSPGPLAFGVYLTEYRDVIRLAGPQPLLRPALAALGALGRLRGYRLTARR